MVFKGWLYSNSKEDESLDLRKIEKKRKNSLTLIINWHWEVKNKSLTQITIPVQTRIISLFWLYQVLQRTPLHTCPLHPLGCHRSYYLVIGSKRLLSEQWELAPVREPFFFCEVIQSRMIWWSRCYRCSMHAVIDWMSPARCATNHLKIDKDHTTKQGGTGVRCAHGQCPEQEGERCREGQRGVRYKDEWQ